MKFIKFITPQRLMRIIRFWPPYFAAGIKVVKMNENMTYMKVAMVQRPWNTNYVGSHFGGSLYAMCDPFFMFMLLEHLKTDHVVWDKAANIEFVSPGKGVVYAEFSISLEKINEIKQEAASGQKVEPKFWVEVKDSKGKVVAKVLKTLYVRKKKER